MSIFRGLSVQDNYLGQFWTLEISDAPGRAKGSSIAVGIFHRTPAPRAGLWRCLGRERVAGSNIAAVWRRSQIPTVDGTFCRGSMPISVDDIRHLVADLKKTPGIGVLITDHNVRER